MKSVVPRLLALSLVSSMLLGGCDATSDRPDEPDGGAPVEASQPIMNGTPDTDHPAVVWLFNQNEGTSCTGTIIATSGATGYVLTAAHCADMTLIAITTDYRDCIGGRPGPDCQALFPVDEQVYHPGWTEQLETGTDFSLIRFLGASASTPVIPAAASDDGVALGAEVDIVGFGQTEDENNVLRNHKVVPIDTIEDSLFSHLRTVCFGDSGGPAILDGKVVGVSSFVNSDSCYGSGFSGRVEDVYDDFIAPYIEQDPVVLSCDQCLRLAVDTIGGLCGAETAACREDVDCASIDVCKAGCLDNAGCENDCVLSHPAGAVLYDAIFRCASCDVCVPSCGEDPRCDAPPPTAVSSSTGLPVDAQTSGGTGGSGDGGGAANDDSADDDGCSVGKAGAGRRTAGAFALIALASASASVRRRRRAQLRG